MARRGTHSEFDRPEPRREARRAFLRTLGGLTLLGLYPRFVWAQAGQEKVGLEKGGPEQGLSTTSSEAKSPPTQEAGATNPAVPDSSSSWPPATPKALRIGVLLPLTGRFAPPALEVQRGIELGVSLRGPLEGPTLKVVYQDTREDTNLTVQAIEAFAEQEDVVAVIGPLVSATADAAARAAERVQLPLMALIQKPNIPYLGSYVFRCFMTPEQQVRQLVAYSMDNLGLTRFAVAYPETRYAMELTALFWDEVSRRGGLLTALEGYAPDTRDFLPIARRLGSQHHIDTRRAEFDAGEKAWLEQWRSKGQKPPQPYQLPPKVDFDALFISDQPRMVAPLSSALAYAEIPMGRFRPPGAKGGVRLLGISSWNDASLSAVDERYVQDALFVDQFFAGAPEPEVRAFVEQFKRVHKGEPTSLSAVGYDAYGLLHRALSTQLMAGLPLTRSGVRDGLLRMPRYAGATGSLKLDNSGELQRNLPVISVEGKRLVRVHPLGLEE